MPTSTDPKAISRRRFLKRTGWVAAGLTVTIAASYPFVIAAVPALPSTNEPTLQDAWAWIQALPDGRIRFFCPRMEMGQGTGVGLAQIVAEELNMDQSGIDCVLPDTSQTPPFQMTVGSEGIENLFDPVSFGAARLRETLRVLAAQKAGLTPDQVLDGRGGFVLPDGGTLEYGALVQAGAVVMAASELIASEQAPPRYAVTRRGNYQAIGQSWGHHEFEAIVTGQTVYSRDVSHPEMLYGQAIRPPVFGAKLQSVDGAAAEAMRGVRAIVFDRKNSFVGVVTENPFILPQAVAAIAVRWEMPEALNQDHLDAWLDVEKLRADDDFEHELAAEGDVAAGRGAARYSATARYDTPFLAHAAIEPRAAMAHVTPDKAEVWCGTQDAFFVQRRVAKALGRNPDDVVVHPHRIGGGFGGRVVCQASEEAALLSAAVGRPVRVQWDRETEFQNNYFQPGFSHFIDAGVTDAGIISHWDHDFVSSPIITGLAPGVAAWVMDRVMADEGTARGSLPHYQMANRRVRYSDIRTPVPIGAWRGLGAAPNTFAIESMMDELAASAAQDPLELRLKNLPPTSERLAGVLRRVAEISGWGEPSATNNGRGIACAVYRDETAVAVVAEVQIDRVAGELRVSRIWCAQDCGLVVNPDQVENQIIGNIVWGCSMALKERLTIADGAVEQRNFDGYEILRHDETPDITVALVIPQGAPPVAVGESAFAPVAPAISNAIFAATGQRIRRLPVSFGDVFPTQRS